MGSSDSTAAPLRHGGKKVRPLADDMKGRIEVGASDIRGTFLGS